MSFDLENTGVFGVTKSWITFRGYIFKYVLTYNSLNHEIWSAM